MGKGTGDEKGLWGDYEIGKFVEIGVRIG